MRSFLRRARPSVVGIAVVAALSLAGIATAAAVRENSITTRQIRDNQVNTRDLRNNSITTRDIRDNQVNTRDIRDGAVRGIDVRDGSLALADLGADVQAALAGGELVDPRAHAGSCCLSWARGPEAIAEVAAPSADPIPAATSGRAWRSVVLEPGVYVVQSSGQATREAAGSEGAATRLFLGGSPVEGGGYTHHPAGDSPLPVPYSRTTVVAVPAGDQAARQLVQRAVSLGGPASLTDSLLVWRVSPR